MSLLTSSVAKIIRRYIRYRFIRVTLISFGTCRNLAECFRKKRKKKKKGAGPTKGRRVVLRTGKVNYEKKVLQGAGVSVWPTTYVSPDTIMMC